MVDKVLFSSAKNKENGSTDDWATPIQIVHWAEDNILSKPHYKVKKKFVLDPCASQETAKAPNYYTKEQDGLTQDWSAYGNYVWCNPPYSQINKWAKKAVEEMEKNAHLRIVWLAASRTDTVWYHLLMEYTYKIWFLKGRVTFGGDKAFPAPFPSALFLLGAKLSENPEIPCEPLIINTRKQ